MRLLSLICATLCGSTLLATHVPFYDNNVWLGVDVLYWQPWENTLVATTQKFDVFTTSDFTQASVVHPHFEWDFGYRVNAGYLFSSKLWAVEASWTDFSSWISQHRSSDGSAFIGMFPIWSLSDDVIEGDYVFESHLKWKISIKMANVQFNRYYKFYQNRLYLVPFVGIRSAWIKQHSDITYAGGMFLIGIAQSGISINGTDFIKMENNYWGIGPRLGLSPQLDIGRGLGINAEVAVSGLYGFFKTHQKETYIAKTRFSHDQHLNRFRTIGDVAAGLQWKTPLYSQRYALTLKADWEYHIFFAQFELKRDRFGLVPKSRNLSTQGVTFSGCFDF